MSDRAIELADAADGKRPDHLIFTMPGGSVMRMSNWRQATFVPARSRAGRSDRFRVHDLRHTATSLMIQAGYPPKMLQEIMGHASITTTLDLYGHLYVHHTCIRQRWTAMLTGSTRQPECPMRPMMRPKYGQMTTKTIRTRNDQRVCLGKHERARRDSNPKPSDP